MLPREPLPKPGPAVTPEVQRLVDLLVAENDDFGKLALLAHFDPGFDLSTALFDVQGWIRKFEISRTQAVQILRRLDRDAADDMASLSYETPDEMSVAAYRAMSIIEGTVKATLIDGPAKGSTTPHISVSQSTAVVVSVATGIQSIVDQARDRGVDPAVVSELEQLAESVRKGDEIDDRIGRFTRLLEKLRPYADLAAELAKLGGTIFA
jgi:hypothetical protein